jgi:hypothetical protein
MRYIDQHKHIKSRADFFRILTVAIRASTDLLTVAPGDGRIMSVLRQLEMIRTWTDNGRDPTKEERWKTQIGVILMREFETEGDQRVIDWAELCKEVEGYFNLWVDDATYQTVDEDDLPDFPEDEDDVTHLRI